MYKTSSQYGNSLDASFEQINRHIEMTAKIIILLIFMLSGSLKIAHKTRGYIVWSDTKQWNCIREAGG